MEVGNSFVDLGRRFRKLNPQAITEEAAIQSYTSLLGHEVGLSWDDLLKKPLVVVLGEPGSGKTREFQERASALVRKEQLAFFIRLDRIIAEPLTAVLDSEEKHRFQQWSKNDLVATFFLDSVDEAKFSKTSDFTNALDRFRNAIGGNRLTRARILISSRLSEWRPQADAYELIMRFSLPAQIDKSEGENGKLTVVQIEPLNSDQVKQFVRERNASDSEGFIAALTEKHAWEFARRPIDVVDLLRFWKTHGKLGDLIELLEFDITSKLRETSDRRWQDPLTTKQLREGAETLGAAVSLCRQFALQVPDDVYVCEDAVIDPSVCLPNDWTPDQQLVGQYLKSHKSRYGIYLIGLIENRKYWQHQTDRVDFDRVLFLLRERVKTIVRSREDVTDISVIGIDFTDPRECTDRSRRDRATRKQ